MKKMMYIFTTMLVTLFWLQMANAQKIPFQGRLFDDGVAVEGLVTIEFDIYSVSWTETHTDVNVSSGLYSVLLGQHSPLPSDLFHGVGSRTLDITINGQAMNPIEIYPAMTGDEAGFQLPGNIFMDNREHEGVEHGFFQVDATDGAHSFLEPSNFWMKGPESPNLAVEFWGNKNVPKFNLWGNQPDGEGWFHNHISLWVEEEGGQQYGEFRLWGSNGNENVHFSTHHLEPNNGANRPYMRMIGNVHEHLNMGVRYDETSGEEFGYFALRGSDGGENIYFGSLHWEGLNAANRPFMTMKGNDQGTDLVWLSVDDDGVGGEQAHLQLNATNGSYTHFGSNGFSINGPSTPNYHFGTHISDEFPHLNLLGNQQDPVEGWFHRHLTLVVNDDGTNQCGSIELFGNNGNTNFTLGASEGNRPYLSMVGNVHEHLNMGVSYDETSGEEFGYFTLRGGNGHDIISFGSLHWEGVNASNRPVMRMKGNDQGIDLVWLSVDDDGAGGEHAGIVFRSTNGIETAINHQNINVANSAVHVSGDELGNGAISINSQGGNSINLSNSGGISLSNSTGLNTHIDTARINVANTSVEISGTQTGNGEIWINGDGGSQIRILGSGSVGEIALNDNVGGSINMYGNGTIEASGTITCASLVETSDIKLKTNILPLTNSLLNIQKLRGVSFNWADANKSQDNQIGLIAQEVEEVYPEFVHTQDNGIKAVNYSQMVAVLLEAIKELNAKVEMLEEQNKNLQASIKSQEEIRQEIDLLKALVMKALVKEQEQQSGSDIAVK